MADINKLVIFGTTDFSQLARFYFESEGRYQVVAYTVDRNYLHQNAFDGLPVLPFEDIESFYPPHLAYMFIGLGYNKMNKLRKDKFHQAKQKGYSLATYISPYCTYLSKESCGENCMIMEECVIQPYAKIADNVIVWSGSVICHHSTIHSHVYIAPRATVLGRCEVESYSFIGANSIIFHTVKVAEGTLVGAGAIIKQDTVPYGVYVGEKATFIEDKNSLDIQI